MDLIEKDESDSHAPVSTINFDRKKSVSISVISFTAASEIRQRINHQAKKEWFATAVLPAALVAYSVSRLLFCELEPIIIFFQKC